MTEVTITRGIPAGKRRAVASLYWDAFGAKLRPALGDRVRGERFIASVLNAEQVFCAQVDGAVLGVVGFYAGREGAIGFSYRELARQGSPLTAPWRALLLAVLARKPDRRELLLDGLSVSPAARGTGIGTQLIAAAVAEAQRQGKQAVRLSVVDSNPRARALYERLGFVPDKTVSIGVFGRMFGFQKSTDMVLRVGQGGAV